MNTFWWIVLAYSVLLLVVILVQWIIWPKVLMPLVYEIVLIWFVFCLLMTGKNPLRSWQRMPKEHKTP